MKRFLAIVAVAAGAWMAAQQASGVRPLPELVPAGAVLYLEARNFAALLNEWNASSRKAEWLKSANYQAFSRSRLFLRLDEVHKEYAALTGVPPGLDLLRSVAGGETALAVYDVNQLEFLYITRIASARAMESLLWRSREQFSERRVGASVYFVKSGGAGNRTACFAVSNGMLLAATKEDAMAGALSLMANGSAAPLAREAWFQDAFKAAGAPGEIRMAANLARLGAAPAFRSHWIQRNGPELRRYRAAVSDLHRNAGEIREDRVLLRATPSPAPDVSATAALMAMAPAGTGLVRLWAAPSPDAVESLVRQKILNPGPAVFASSKRAPDVSLEAAEAGGGDLETRIDEPVPLPDGPVYRSGPFRRLLESAGVRAALQIQSGRPTTDGVFITTDSAVAIEAGSDWNAEGVRAALRDSVEALYTTRNIGLVWREENGVWRSDGLARLAMAIKGRTLIVGSRPELVRAIRDQNGAPVEPVSYRAIVRLGDERPRYVRAMRMMDGAAPPGPDPPFFSANLASLFETLLAADRIDVRESDSGGAVTQTVRYFLAP